MSLTPSVTTLGMGLFGGPNDQRTEEGSNRIQVHPMIGGRKGKRSKKYGKSKGKKTGGRKGKSKKGRRTRRRKSSKTVGGKKKRGSRKTRRSRKALVV